MSAVQVALASPTYDIAYPADTYGQAAMVNR